MDLAQQFQPVYSHITGAPVPVPTLARYEVVPRVGYTFDVEGGHPTLPLRVYGEVDRDAGPPFRYAVDADGRAWLDDARGGPLRLVAHADLLSTGMDERTEHELRAELGLPPQSPAWMVEARAHGWSPLDDGAAREMQVSVSGNVELVSDHWVRRLPGSLAWLVYLRTADKHVDVSLTSNGGDRILWVYPEDSTDLSDKCEVRLHLPGDETWRMEAFWSYESRNQVKLMLVPYLAREAHHHRISGAGGSRT